MHGQASIYLVSDKGTKNLSMVSKFNLWKQKPPLFSSKKNELPHTFYYGKVVKRTCPGMLSCSHHRSPISELDLPTQSDIEKEQREKLYTS